MEVIAQPVKALRATGRCTLQGPGITAMKRKTCPLTPRKSSRRELRSGNLPCNQGGGRSLWTRPGSSGPRGGLARFSDPLRPSRRDGAVPAVPPAGDAVPPPWLLWLRSRGPYAGLSFPAAFSSPPSVLGSGRTQGARRAPLAPGPAPPTAVPVS